MPSVMLVLDRRASTGVSIGPGRECVAGLAAALALLAFVMAAASLVAGRIDLLALFAGVGTSVVLLILGSDASRSAFGGLNDGEEP